MIMEKIIKIGEKGQITIPKIARENWKINPGDKAKIIVTPSGMIIMHIIKEESPEDKILETIKKAPRIDFKKLWKEVEKEREESERK